MLLCLGKTIHKQRYMLKRQLRTVSLSRMPPKKRSVSTPSRRSKRTKAVVTDGVIAATTTATIIEVSSIAKEDEAEEEPLTVYPKLKYFETLPKLEAKGKLLPPEFYTHHNDEFIKGLAFIVEKDPSLLETISTKPFSNFGRVEKTRKELEHITSGRFYFDRLVSGLISQQISGKAAMAIQKKVIDNLCPENEKLAGQLPSPEVFYSKTEEELRSCGLSLRKSEYIRGLAKAFIGVDEHEKIRFTHDHVLSMDDQQLDSYLQSFKGIGPWSSSMFMMFALERFDIFEAGDLGIKRGLANYLKDRPELQKEVNLFVKKGGLSTNHPKKKKAIAKGGYPSEEVMELVASQFEPYRTLFMMVIWRISDITMDVLEK